MDWPDKNENELAAPGLGEDETGAPIADYRELKVWQAGIKLAKTIYRCTADFPREELYGLTAQIRRASISIPSNIAEGYGRETTGAYIQFLRIAQGSIKEVETLAILAHELNYLPLEEVQMLNSQISELSKMLRGLLRKLQQRERP